MAIFEVIGTDIKVTFEYTAPTALVQSIVGDAAHYLWKEELEEEGEAINPFSEASNQDKLDVVDAHVKQVILDLANTFKSIEAQKLARELESENEYEIE